MSSRFTFRFGRPQARTLSAEPFPRSPPAAASAEEKGRDQSTWLDRLQWAGGAVAITGVILSGTACSSNDSAPLEPKPPPSAGSFGWDDLPSASPSKPPALAKGTREVVFEVPATLTPTQQTALGFFKQLDLAQTHAVRERLGLHVAAEDTPELKGNEFVRVNELNWLSLELGRRKVSLAPEELSQLRTRFGLPADGGMDRALAGKVLETLASPIEAPPAPKPPPPKPPPPPPEPPALEIPRFDGSTPAPGTTNTNAAQLSHPPFVLERGQWTRAAYDEAIDQFAVANNPRYTPRYGNTYCNIFVWDVTRAMGAEIPHWLTQQGDPTGVGQGWEVDANSTVNWLHRSGGRFGWGQISAEQAQEAANKGHPSVVVWKNPGGIGHVAVVRPGTLNGNGPTIAQAGGQNFNHGHVFDSFPRTDQVEYWAVG